MKRLLISALAALFLVPVTVGAQETSKTIPTSVASDCSKDVTAQVKGFVSGGSGTLKLQPGGCYIVNEKVSLAGKSNITLDGQGATLRKTQEVATCKQHAGFLQLSSGTNQTVKNLNLERVGGPGGYDPCHYAEHGVELQGAQNATITNLTMDRIRGDCLYIQGANGVEVTDLDCKSNGRQGGAISRGTNVHIDGFKVRNSARSGFDFEANSASDTISAIEIEHFDISSNLIAFPSQGYNAVVADIYIHDGAIRRALSVIYDRQVRPSQDNCRTGQQRRNWRFESVLVDASVTQGYGGATAVFCGTENVTFSGVSMPGGQVLMEASRGQLIVRDSCLKSVKVIEPSAPVQQSGNTTPPCSGTPPPSTSTTTTSTSRPPSSTSTSTTTTTRPPPDPDAILRQIYELLAAYFDG